MQVTIPPDKVLSEILNHFNMTEAMIKTKRRFTELVVPRQMFCYFAWKYSDITLPSIGEMIGGMDHATVIHSRRTVENRKDTDPAFNKHFEEIKAKILRYSAVSFAIDSTVAIEVMNTKHISPPYRIEKITL